MLVDDPNNLVRDLLVRVGLPNQPTPTVSMAVAMAAQKKKLIGGASRSPTTWRLRPILKALPFLPRAGPPALPGAVPSHQSMMSPPSPVAFIHTCVHTQPR